MATEKLLWVEAPQERHEKVYLFALDPVMGILDFNSRRISENSWLFIRESNPSEPAHLIVPPYATVGELREAVEVLLVKGGFRSVHISIAAL